MKAVILDSATMGEYIDFSPILNILDTVIYKTTENAQVSERISDADVVIINKVTLDENVLKSAKKLKLICVFAVGYNNIDINYCKKHNIKVRNVPGYATKSVCQHTFALLFSLIENISYYDDFVKSGKYTESGVANHIGKPFFEISGKNWGIIGMGAIGRSVADAAAAFGANVYYSSISGAVRQERYKEVDINTLFLKSDIISVHAPLNEKTRLLIGGKELRMMKKDCLIVNVGRGAIIDENALAQAIDNKTLGGAAIDVFTNEPPLFTDALMNIKNKNRVIFSPHIAWASVQARERCVKMTSENIAKFIEGESVNDVW